MGELHTKISRRDIKVTQKYQLSSKKVKKKKKKIQFQKCHTIIEYDLLSKK